jgi:4,5-dihydroxyphthalate decarboxylase
VPGARLDHVEVSPIVAAFRRMVRTLEFDVSEMAITTYLTAKAHGKAFTALPVFVMRQFHHTPIVYNVKSGVKSPKDLEGKKVGVRAYTVTTGVWARGILASEYGVDLSKVTWVVVDEEHAGVPEAGQCRERPRQPRQMVAKGELAAAIGAGAVDSPMFCRCSCLARGRGRMVSEDGIYPVNHTVVVKDSLLQSDPTWRRACSAPSRTRRPCS